MFKSITSLLFVVSICLPCLAASYTIDGNAADQTVSATGGDWSGAPASRVGKSGETECAMVYVFELPALNAAEVITTADVALSVVGGNNWGALFEKGLDLYAVRMGSATSITTVDFWAGEYGADSAATAIQEYIVYEAENLGGNTLSSLGRQDTSADAEIALAAWIQSMYDSPAYDPAGTNYVFLRVNSRGDLGNDRYFTLATANNAVPGDRPVLTLSTGAPCPEANAGPDQTVQADLVNTPVTITLDGATSTPDDSPIASYAWTEDAVEIATGITADVAFAVGMHTVTLTVADAEGDADTDTVIITIEDGTPTPPVADAGADQAIPDTDEDGFEDITLDGTASYAADARATLVSVSWTTLGGTELSTAFSFTATFAEGYHPLTLTVTDSLGSTDTDTVNVSVGREQLLNLPGDRPDFPAPTDIVWPEAVGVPHISLWYGDKFAALSITIDDNVLPDHAWWMQMAQAYDFTPTWFMVVNNIETEGNWAFDGVWSDWIDLFAAGGDLQTHTMTHHPTMDTLPDADVHWEYSESQRLINERVDGADCLALAYPNGRGRPDIAAQYFIAARGVYGMPNGPARINWMETNSAGGGITADYVNSILYGTSGISWLNGSQYKRNWLCVHFHGVNDKPTEEAKLAYIDSLRHLIWWATFVDVAKFGQERDSAEITMVENSEARIAFDITDRMNDLIFDHPLTIKVRIPDSWGGVAVAAQNGTSTGFTLRTEADKDYILLDAIPDRGTVEITSGDAPKPGDADGDDDVDLDDFVILKANFGMTTGATTTEGDFDGDGDVDLDDFVILKTNFGT